MRFVNGLAGHELLIAFCFRFLVSQYAHRVTVFSDCYSWWSQ